MMSRAFSSDAGLFLKALCEEEVVVTELWMSGSEVLVPICSESLGHHRPFREALWNEK